MRQAAGWTGMARMPAGIAAVLLLLTFGMAYASAEPGIPQAGPQPSFSQTQSSIATEGLGIIGRWSGRLEGEGRMELDPAPAGYKVALHVSGPSGCTGTIEGTGLLSGDTITLTQAKDGRVCTIAIKFMAWDTAEVSEHDCSGFHGPACAFRGILKRED